MITLSPPTRERLVSSGWGAPRPGRDGTHEGLDFRAPVGSEVLAAADGVVVQAKNIDNSLAGKFVAIEHAGGVFTRYLHNLQNLVSVGDRVRRGRPIALLGQTGTSGTGQPHVHFDVKLSTSAFGEYVKRFGTPAPGYSEPRGIGVGVPAEALMSGAIYLPSVREASLQRGVSFYKATGISTVAVVGAGMAIGLIVRAWR